MNDEGGKRVFIEGNREVHETSYGWRIVCVACGSHKVTFKDRDTAFAYARETRDRSCRTCRKEAKRNGAH